MTDSIVAKVRDFRTRLLRFFKFRADATMDLIDALAEKNHHSVVEISLSPLFRRQYSSITDAADNMFRINAEQNPNEDELRRKQLELSSLLVEKCPPPGARGFTLLATDSTPNPRIYSLKLTDRSFVHASNHIPGQKPVTVGHEYSLVVYLPEDEKDKKAHWTYPLSIRRVRSKETGPQTGLGQVQELVTQTLLKYELCVVVADAAYSTKKWVDNCSSIQNLVQISRLRCNRVLYRRIILSEGNKQRGRPAIYGESFHLKEPPVPEQEVQFEKISSSGKRWNVKVSLWTNLLMRGDGPSQADRHSIDVVRVQIFADDGGLVFKKPLWLVVGGKRRDELSLRSIYESYSQRYDIEHCFRFGKQKLLLNGSQTSDTRHEENLTWTTMLSFAMLYHTRNLSLETKRSWEKHKKSLTNRTVTVSQVQRDFHRIIRQIGTPARIPKPRGKSPGRRLGVFGRRRITSPVVRKFHRTAIRC
jgi:hypothetical protein